MTTAIWNIVCSKCIESDMTLLCNINVQQPRSWSAHLPHRSRAAAPAAGYSARGHARESSCCVWLKFWRCAASGPSQEGWTLKNPSPYGQLQLLGLSLPCSDCCEITWLHYRWDILHWCRWWIGKKKHAVFKSHPHTFSLPLLLR